MPPRVVTQTRAVTRLANPAQGGNVLDRITPLSFDPDQGFNFLFYGESRTGKTTLWSSWPGPILVIICSGGQKPGELRSIDTPEMRAKIDTVTLQTPSELDQICRGVETGILKHRTGKPYATMVLDHVSGFQDLKLMAYKGLSQVPQQKSYGIATIKDWGEIASQCKEHLIKLLSLPQHVIVIAQERLFLPKDDENPDAKAVRLDISAMDLLKPKVGAALIPSLTGWLQPAVDYGAQTYIRPRIVEEESITKVQGKDVKEIIRQRGEGFEYCARVGVNDVFYTKFRTTAALVGFTADNRMPESIVLGDTVTGVRKKPSGYEQVMELIRRQTQADRA